MDFIKTYQLDIMLFIAGTCGVLAIMTLLIKFLPRKTKYILVSMELSATLLLLFDRFAYIYKGDVSTLGYYMVRISNGAVYIFSLVIPFLGTRFIIDVLRNDVKLKKKPAQLIAADVMFALGTTLVVISRFTGLYYVIDAQNNYQRSPLNPLCNIAPFFIVIMQEWALIKYRKKIKKNLLISMMICLALPVAAAITQIFMYGISLINIVTAVVACVFFTHALEFLGDAADRARQHEIEFYRDSQKKEAALFKEMMEALANAIDAKDKYTKGHSTRVAAYARMIAQEAGLSSNECDQVHFAGLLHDIGKIGVRSEIINKNDKLTDGEYVLIKTHPEMGQQILSSIKNAPYLCDSALYHHERYDGCGYPAGLSGEDIPQIARIIAVADAFDAMTSVRTYREPLDLPAAREEILKGSGAQFDPEYASIMIKLIDDGRIVLEKQPDTDN